MAASGFTPIQLYRTSTALAVPTAGNLAAGELAINLTDEALYFKNAAGVVTLLADSSGALGSVTSVNASGGTTGLSFTGGPVTSSGTLTLAGTLAVANGGTGATTAGAARTALGATTLGGNLFTITNPGAITFPRFNADNTVSALNAADFRTAIGAGTGGGSVTSVSGTGTVNGLTLTGTVTSSGSLTLGGTLSGISLTTQVTGTLPIANGGTGATTAGAALTSLGAYPASNPSGFTSNAGTVTSVGGTGTVNGITLTGTVSSSGNLTLGGTLSGVSLTTQVAGTLPIANGGTGATTAANAQTALDVPSRSGSGASGTWGISISGNAATATSATSATSATTATTANALNTGNNYQVNSLGVGTGASGTAGEIRATNNVTAFFSSDARLKENVQPIADALGVVSAVGGKTFDWTDDYIASHGGDDGYFVRKSDFGVIAQDVEAVFPLAVRTREDGTLAVDYEKLVAVAFAAIAELRAELEVLKRDT